jgi:glycosyltransferase involved in cell wall biosynthesis
MAWGSDVYLANARQRAYGRFALRRADLAMTDSAALRARLLEMGADESRTELVNWGVDLNCFRPSEDRAELRRRLGLDDRPVLLSPRGFGSVYNTKTILEAYERAKERVPDLQLVLKHLASEDPDLGRALPEDVRVVGHVPYEQMRDWFCAADICISIPNSDSSPRSVWEAMACGVPCVLSDLPWVHELIQPATHALVVPIDPQPVADAIVGLALDPRLRAQISSAGRSLVAEHKDAKAEMDRLSDVYVALARRER